MAQRILTLCTGNAARSVMLGVYLEQLAEYNGSDVKIRTAGTLTISQQPAGLRVRSALQTIPEFSDFSLGSHRSTQLDDELAAWPDLIVAMEHDHIRYVRARHPEAAARTATIYRLIEDLASREGNLAERLKTLDLAGPGFEADREVIDPAGGEAEQYEACAKELWELAQVLHGILEEAAQSG
ncbi:MAG: hypothetical protein WCJ28_02020 [Actinomycetota bacterium]